MPFAEEAEDKVNQLTQCWNQFVAHYQNTIRAQVERALSNNSAPSISEGSWFRQVFAYKTFITFALQNHNQTSTYVNS